MLSRPKAIREVAEKKVKIFCVGCSLMLLAKYSKKKNELCQELIGLLPEIIRNLGPCRFGKAFLPQIVGEKTFVA